ncbi:hypothetical protein GCM10009827_109740 [Dactylosporangium maewongense]|uniref:Integrase n=1 Tax=Dactylosporangium maewongense TaxID=634393 RepID=A0ABP4P3C8_9ACTN
MASGHSLAEPTRLICPDDIFGRYRHLLHALYEFEQFYNGHRPHQGIANARPLRSPPTPITDPEQISLLDIRRRDHLGSILHEYQHAA